jgi:hypothetical protein
MGMERDTNGGSRSWARRTTLYQEYLAERDEILRHKWLQSEKVGHDIGFDAALMDWVTYHRAGWRRARHATT